MYFVARRYTVQMRRTSLVLAEALRVKKVLELPTFFGSRIWQGDLSAMREDQPPSKRSSAKRKKTKK